MSSRSIARSRGVEYKMFLYKDERFGCFPKACAVCLYSRDILQEFLLGHPDIDNRLACLVRDIYNHEYVKLCLVVVAAFGIQLIEPFHAKTISKSSTHNTLGEFFRKLFIRMEDKITEDFFNFESAWFPEISTNLLESVKKSYGNEVVDVINKVSSEHMEEAVNLANFMQPGL